MVYVLIRSRWTIAIVRIWARVTRCMYEKPQYHRIWDSSLLSQYLLTVYKIWYFSSQITMPNLRWNLYLVLLLIFNLCFIYELCNCIVLSFECLLLCSILQIFYNQLYMWHIFICLACNFCYIWRTVNAQVCYF